MKKTHYTPIALLLTLSTMTFSTLAFPTPAHAEESFLHWLIAVSRQKGVEPVKNALYDEECGACHFPFQPGFLPERSWRKLLSAKQLDDHFDDSAELDEDVRVKILQYAVDHSADKSWYKRSRKIMAYLDDNDTPLRITQTAYIKEKHSEIPAKLIADNPDVNSLSFCNNCHTQAEKGIFDNDTVVIPGYGHW